MLLAVCLLPQSLPAEEMDADLDFSALLGERGAESSPPPAPAPVKEYTLEGEVRPSVWYPLHEPYEMRSTHRMDLLMEKPGDDSLVVARLKADYQSRKEKDTADADIRELYVQKRFTLAKSTRMSFTAGKKIVHWGKGDEIRPVDRVSPEDLRHFLYYDKNDRKTGIPGFFLESSFQSGLRIEGFWSPVFVASTMPEADSHFAPPLLDAYRSAGGRLHASDEDWIWDNDASLGLRISLPVKNADISFYAWKGKDPMPHLRATHIKDRITVSDLLEALDIPVPEVPNPGTLLDTVPELPARWAHLNPTRELLLTKLREDSSLAYAETVEKLLATLPDPDSFLFLEIPPLPSDLAYDHRDTLFLGADMEFSAGAYVFRGEAAWQMQGNYELVDFTRNPELLYRFPQAVVQKDKLDFLFGIDRNDLLLRNLFANVQYVGIFLPDHGDYLQNKQFRHGMTVCLRYSILDSRISGMWRLFTWLDSHDRQHQVELSFKPAKNLLFTTGVFFYDGGTEKDLFGQFREKDFSFLRASLIF